jgi:hypothetical protein
VDNFIDKNIQKVIHILSTGYPQDFQSYPQVYPQAVCVYTTVIHIVIHIIHSPYYYYYYVLLLYIYKKDVKNDRRLSTIEDNL